MKNKIYIALGWLNVGLGTLGVFLPLMPTTVFLLMAAWFFSRSSPRFLRWLETSKLLGRYITNYRSGRGMEVKDKVFTLVLLWLSLGVSEILVQTLWVRILLVIIGLGVTLHILTIKTCRGQASDSEAALPLPEEE